MKLFRFLALFVLSIFGWTAFAQTFVFDPTNQNWVKTRNADSIVVDGMGVTFTEGSTSGSTFITSFPDLTLAPGDSMIVTVTFTTGATVNGGSSNSFRWGVFNDGGTPLTSNINSNNAPNNEFADDLGYYLDYNVNGSSSLAIRGRNELSNVLLSSTSGAPSLSSTVTGTPEALDPATTYTITLIVTRLEEGIEFSAEIDGGDIDHYRRVTTDTDTASSALTTFNQFAFYVNGGTNALDSLKITGLTIVKSGPAAVAPEIVTQPEDKDGVTGDSVTFTVVATGTEPLTYQWKKDNVALVDEDGRIEGATTATLKLSNLQLTDSGEYTVTVENAAGSVDSAAATLVVTAAPEPPVITTQPASTTIEEGQNASFTVVATGTGPMTYQWKLNGVNLVDETDHIAGATTATLTISNAVVGDSGSYTVVVTNPVTSVTSEIAILTVNPLVAPSITEGPASQAVTVGDSVTFSVTVTGSAPLSYQWLKDGTEIDDATEATYTIDIVQLADSGEYTVRVTNPVDSVVSAAATLTVNLPTTGPAAPGALPGSDAGVSGFSLATGAPQAGFVAHWEAVSGVIVGYHLDVSTSPDFTVFVPGYENLAVGNVTSYAVTGLVPGTTYYYRVRADNGLVGDNSAPVAVTMPSADSIVILDDQIASGGANVGLVADENGFLVPTRTQAAYASFGTANFSYNAGPPPNISVSAGASRGIMTYFTPSTSTVSLAVGEMLRATVRLRWVGGTLSDSAGNLRWGLLNSGGNGTANNLPGISARYLPATSNSLTTMPTGNTARGYSGYVVSTHVNATTGTTDGIGFWRRIAATTSSGSNDTATQILGPTGNDIVSTSAFSPIGSYGGGAAGPLLNDASFGNAPDYVTTFQVARTGASEVVLTYVVSRDGDVVMSHTEAHSGEIVTSFDSLMLFSLFGASPRFTEVLIEKVASVPQIVTQPVSDVALAGGSTTLSVVAVGTGELAYQWKKDGVPLVDGNGIIGAQSATLTLDNLQLDQTGSYTVTVSNANGSADSAAAELLVITEPVAPVIAQQPVASVTVDEGEEVKLTVVATGIPAPTYQWKKDGVDVANISGRINGATTAELTINPSLASDSGNYTVVVSNMAATIESQAAVVTVIPPDPPTITEQPQSQNIITGGGVTFSVSVTGTEPFSYQWQFNGVDIPGATSPTYTIPQVRAAHAGNYTVVISNIAATVTSDPAVLTAVAPTTMPDVPVAVAATTYWEGDFTANWNAASGADGYRLDVSTNSSFTSFVPGFNDRDVGPTLSRHVPDLAANTTYYYRVRAYNSFGTSGNSNVISVTTAPLMEEVDRNVDVSAITWLSTRPTENPVTVSTADGTVSFRMQGTSAPTFVGFLPEAIDLQVGQRLTMTLTFETGATVNSTASNSFRMGLFNSNGTRLAQSANIGDSDPTFRDDKGYMINMNFNGSAAMLHGRRAFESDNNLLGTTQDLWGPSFVDETLSSGSTGPFAPWTTYTLSMSIAREVDRTVVSTLLIGGANNNYFLSGADESSGSLNNSRYDQFAMRINGSSNAISQLVFTDLHFTVETFEQPSAPKVTTHPASRTIFEGQSTTFTAEVSGNAPMVFRWLKDGVPLVDDARFSGVATPSLTLTGATLADAGIYSLEITNDLGADLSDPVQLTVDVASPPTIVTAPVNVTVGEGGLATLTVVPGGTPPFTYQWLHNGTPLADDNRFSGAAEATLSVLAAALNEAGTYEVVVTNVKGSANASATLTVNAATSAPSIVEATAASDVQAGRMTANWNRVPNATHYVLEVSTSADFSTLVGGAPIEVGAATSWTLTGLESDALYYYRVRAYNSVGLSEYSMPVSTLVQNNEPPVILSANTTTFTAGIPSSFRVRVEGAPAPTITASSLPAWAQLDAATGLLMGTPPVGTSGDFNFQITASNGNPPAATQAFTLTVAPIPAITAALTIDTLAGTGGQAGAVNASGSAARFRSPLSVASDAAGNVYVADTDNHVIRKIAPDGGVTTFAGEMGSAGSSDGLGADARFNAPTSIVADAQGNLYVADTLNHTIRKITPSGEVTTIAGSAGQSGHVNAQGTLARFNGPQGVALSGTNLFVADTENHVIRQIVLSNNNVTTLAGAAGEPGIADGSAATARFSGPTGIAVANNIVYVTDIDSHTIRSVTMTGETRTIAGYPEATAAADGIGAAARFRQPSGLVASSDGTTLYITDTENHTIRRLIIGSRTVSTGAGLAGSSGTADGIGEVARFNGPAGIGLAAGGGLLIADTENHTVRTATFPIAPRIIQEPQTVTINEGESATFAVVAEGTPAPTYQWFLNGVPIAGATSPTYSVTNANAQTHGGAYTVVVSNTLRSETSQQAFLIVRLTPTATSSSAVGGGGGAPSVWFFSVLATLFAVRRFLARRA